MARKKKEVPAVADENAAAVTGQTAPTSETPQQSQTVPTETKEKSKVGKKKKEKKEKTAVTKERKKPASFKSRLKPDALDELIKAGKITEYKQLIKCGKKSCIDLAKKQNLLSDIEDVNDFVKLGKKSFFSFFFKILLKK